jgi:hypothetical protein
MLSGSTRDGNVDGNGIGIVTVRKAGAVWHYTNVEVCELVGVVLAWHLNLNLTATTDEFRGKGLTDATGLWSGAHPNMTGTNCMTMIQMGDSGPGIPLANVSPSLLDVIEQN